MRYINHGIQTYSPSESELSLKIGEGIVEGLFEIKPSVHPEFPFQDIYANECSFLFLARAGQYIRHTSVLHPMFFWRRSESHAKESLAEFTAQYEFECLIDAREFFNVRLDSGRLLHGFLKYTIVRIAFMFDERDVKTRVAVQAVDRNNEYPARWETFFRIIPLEQFLWLNCQEQGVLSSRLERTSNPKASVVESPIDVVENLMQ